MRETVRQYADALMEAVARAFPGDRDVSRVADEVRDRSRELRERIADFVQAEVKKQVETLGIATKEELDELRQRVWRLEGELESARSGARAAPSRTSRSPAKKRAARKPAAKQAGTRKRAGAAKRASGRTRKGAPATGGA